MKTLVQYLPRGLTSNIDDTFGARMRKARECAGLSIKDASRKAGVTASLLARLESGAANDTSDRTLLSRVASAYGVNQTMAVHGQRRATADLAGVRMTRETEDDIDRAQRYQAEEIERALANRQVPSGPGAWNCIESGCGEPISYKRFHMGARRCVECEQERENRWRREHGR